MTQLTNENGNGKNKKQKAEEKQLFQNLVVTQFRRLCFSHGAGTELEWALVFAVEVIRSGGCRRGRADRQIRLVAFS